VAGINLDRYSKTLGESAVGPAGEPLRGPQQPPAEPLLVRRPPAFRRDGFEFTNGHRHATTMPAAAFRGDLLAV
jgi:hypothetical protein